MFLTTSIVIGITVDTADIVGYSCSLSNSCHNNNDVYESDDASDHPANDANYKSDDVEDFGGVSVATSLLVSASGPSRINLYIIGIHINSMSRRRMEGEEVERNNEKECVTDREVSLAVPSLLHC